MSIGSAIAAFLLLSASLSAAMCVAWLVWFVTRNSGWVDTIWTIGVTVTGGIAALWPMADVSYPRPILVATLIAIWGLRLAVHIAVRTSGIVDDPRYAKLIAEWGSNVSLRMLTLLQKQALVSVPLVVAIAVAAWNPAPGLRALDIAGAGLILIAIVGEAVADFQLRRFNSDPSNKGRVCDAGLWAWSRHPNYFFQWLGWCGYPLIAIDPTGDYLIGYAALGAPICMYWLLTRVSGIPPLEQHMLETRGDAFSAYQARTSAFFPLPPRTA